MIPERWPGHGRTTRRFAIPHCGATAGALDAVREHRVKDFHVHRLRHTFATTYLERGGTLEALQRILGHSTIKLTECYGKLRPHVVAAEMARIDGTADGTMAVSEPSAPRKSLRSW